MGHNEEAHTSSPSTHWEWKKVRVTEPPQGRRAQPPQASSQSPLSRRNARDPLTITVKYRGGAEAYWEVRARGRVFRRPGWLCIHDLMSEINGQHPGSVR